MKRLTACALLLLLQTGCMHLFYDPSGPRECERIETVSYTDDQGVYRTKVIEYGCEIKSRKSGMILIDILGVVVGLLALLL